MERSRANFAKKKKVYNSKNSFVGTICLCSCIYFEFKTFSRKKNKIVEEEKVTRNTT